MNQQHLVYGNIEATNDHNLLSVISKQITRNVLSTFVNAFNVTVPSSNC